MNEKNRRNKSTISQQNVYHHYDHRLVQNCTLKNCGKMIVHEKIDIF